MCESGFVFPKLCDPQSESTKLAQAKRFDPYPDPTIGGDMRGARPLGFTDPRPEPDLEAKKQMLFPANVTIAGTPGGNAGSSSNCFAGRAFVSARPSGAASGGCASVSRKRRYRLGRHRRWFTRKVARSISLAAHGRRRRLQLRPLPEIWHRLGLGLRLIRPRHLPPMEKHSLRRRSKESALVW